jgi:hypothetical protein
MKYCNVSTDIIFMDYMDGVTTCYNCEIHRGANGVPYHDIHLNTSNEVRHHLTEHVIMGHEVPSYIFKRLEGERDNENS